MSEITGAFPPAGSSNEDRAHNPDDEKLKMMGGSEVDTLTDDQKQRLGLLPRKDALPDEERKAESGSFTYAP